MRLSIVLVTLCIAVSYGHGPREDVIWLSEDANKVPGNVVFGEVGRSSVIRCNSKDGEVSKLNWYSESSPGVWTRVEKSGPILEIRVNQPGKKVYTCKSEKHPEWHNASITAFHRGNNREVLTTPDNRIVALADHWDYMDLTCDLSKKVKRVGETHHHWSLYGKRIIPRTRIVNYDNGTLRVHNPGPRDSGVYMCEFYNETNNLIAIDYFEVKGAGYAHQDHASSKNYMQADSVSVTCEVYGYPVPKVTWLRDGDNFDNSSGRVFFGPNDLGIANTTLKIVNLQYEDRAEYTCVAENALGSANVTTLVRVKDKLAALWPFLGIVAEVLVLVTIIFIYERRHANKEAEDSKPVDPDRAKFLPSSDDAEGTRQRNVNT